jgi:N-acetylmuramoyl-L-alanine amidase
MRHIKYLKPFLLLLFFVKVMADTDVLCDKKINISFAKQPNINAFILNNPHRLVIDFAHNLGVSTNYYKFIDKKCIKKARVNSNYKNKVRVVYELLTDVTLKTSIAKIDNYYVATLSLSSKTGLEHIEAKKQTAAVKTSKQKTASTHIEPNKTKTVVELKHSLLPNKKVEKLKDLIIVVDPGHGGTDPGAIAVNGAREKNVCLQIAKKLVAKINATYGLKAYMTRTTDKFLELRHRTEFAKQKNADLFISIHADSHPNSHAKGVSVYALSESGATSEVARILADKENTLYTENDKHAHHGYILESVLIDLQQVATVHQSLNLGKKLLKRISQVAKRHSVHVEQAAFVVLKSPTIPSVLIESGFLSNKNEAIKLTNSRYQDDLSGSFMLSILDYFTERKIKNSYFYAARNNKAIKVISGDNLVKIANRHNTSVSEIIKVNKLKSKKLAIGQKIILPGT